MIVNAQTKISKLINENPEAIEVIASINKHFSKLKNPVLRKLLAPRVNVAEAARIGGATVEEFLNRLKTIGFEVDLSSKESEINNSNITNKMEEISKRKLVSLDVRPDIERGEDPFKRIMGILKDMPDDSVLEVINVFEPIPLINVLKERGYESLTERPEERDVRTYFWRSGEVKTVDELPKVDEVEEPSFEQKLKSFGDKLITIDVRGLEMPEPMMNILIETEKLPEGYGLFVHHQRIPQYLLPELKKRGLNILHRKEDENSVKLLIYK
jgi:TusA-related sulfurtransferase/uncharacterized protein (DUF2249 family)